MKVLLRFTCVAICSAALFFIFACESAVYYSPPDGSTEMAITHYSFGRMTIDGKDYTGDLSIQPGGKVNVWIVNTGTHILDTDDLDSLITGDVKKIIIGTGNSGDFELSNELQRMLEDLRARGIQTFVDKTGNAVRHFNKTSKEGLLACFHLNC